MTERFTDGVEEGAADFAIADLSVTSARNEAVEFSTPWMTLGISIIFQKPRQAPPGLMSFLSPFTVEVWIYISLGNMIIILYAKSQLRVKSTDYSHTMAQILCGPNSNPNPK